MIPANSLAALRDIHLPTAVSGWPPGPGWWLAAALLLGALGGLLAWYWRQHRRQAHRRAARHTLEAHFRQWQASGDSGGYVRALNAVLKRAAMVGCGREAVAHLSGAEWQAFLDARWRRPPPLPFREALPPQAPYLPPAPPSSAQPPMNIEQLHQLAKRWLREYQEAPC